MNRTPLLLLPILILLATLPAQASSVRSVSLEEMLAGAELVFEGRVLGLETRAGRRRIETCADIEVLEVISGPPVASPLTLCFAGGSLGERSYRVGGLRAPLAGEHGIYFVESLDSPRLHPLYGWSQGHFRVDATGLVHTEDGRPVTGMEGGAGEPVLGPSEGVARGVRVGRSRRSLEEPRSLDASAFKARLRALRGGRAH